MTTVLLYCIGGAMMFNDSITVFHLNKDNTYSKYTYTDLYFEHNKGIAIADKGVENASSGTIIIPTTKEISIREKDSIVDGIIEDELDEKNRLSSLQQKYTVYTVLSVDDLRKKSSLAHWEVVVK